MCQATTGGNNPTKLHSCETLHCSGFVLSYLTGAISSARVFFFNKHYFNQTLPLFFSSQTSPLGHHPWSHRSCPPDDQTVSQSPLPQRTEPPETGKWSIISWIPSPSITHCLQGKDRNESFILLQTALHLAVITEQPHLVERLLKAGSDPRLADNSGNTALHIACKKGSLSCFAVITQNSQRHLASLVSFPNYSGNYQLKWHTWSHSQVICFLHFCNWVFWIFSPQDTTVSTWLPLMATFH